MQTERIRERDESIWTTLDVNPGLTAREIAEIEGLSVSLTHQALVRMDQDGRVRQAGDGAVIPYTWEAIGADDDDVALVEITESDARFVIHMLRAMLDRDMAGPPTEALIERISRSLDEGE